MKKFTLNFLLILICISSIDKVYAQNRTILGLDFTNDFVDQDLRPGFGLNLTRSFSEKSSIEIGTYYRSYDQSLNLQIDDQTFDVNIMERHLSIPITYKFSTKFINLSAGPSFDIFLNWKQKGATDFKVDSYNIDPEYNFGVMLKVGKDIRLAENLFFEPEIRLNPITRIDRFYFGLGLNLKLEI